MKRPRRPFVDRLIVVFLTAYGLVLIARAAITFLGARL